MMMYMTKGKGVFTVNKRPMGEYFGRETSSMIINQPAYLHINLLMTFTTYDRVCN
jgi:ribosomal protein S9